MTEILNGTVLAKAIREKARQRVEGMKQPPGLGVILAGDDPASHLYVSLKEKAARDIGIYVEKHLFPESVKTRTLLEKIKELNKRPDIHGILVQLPLPEGTDTDKVIEAIDPDKDVDGFHPENRKSLLANDPLLVPPVALGVMRLIQASRQPLYNKRAVILGNSSIFAEPVIELLKDAGVSAEFITRETPGFKDICKVADIVIIAIGEANFLKRDMVKDSAIVIDVGTNRTKDNKVIGDADAKNLDGHAGFMSRVPGGVGPLTVAYLLMNVIKAGEVQKRTSG